MVSPRVIDACGLSDWGTADVTVVGRTIERKLYPVRFDFPGGLEFTDIWAAGGGINIRNAEDEPVDVLIGMDVITQGDLAVSNWNGRTAFMFSVPPQREVSFRREG